MYFTDKIYQNFPTPDTESMILKTFTLLKTKQKTSKSKVGKLHFENKMF